MPERYTAVLKIVKIDETIDRGTGRGDDRHISKDTELLAITIRNKTLEGLIAKSIAHLELVEDHTK